MLRLGFAVACLLLVPQFALAARRQRTAVIPAIVPRPAKIQMGKGAFRIAPSTPIYYQAGSKEAGRIAKYLSNRLAPATGVGLNSHPLQGSWQPKGSIVLTMVGADQNLGPEGYELISNPRYVLIRAPRPAGLFRGVQTFRQMLPTEIEEPKRVPGGAWTVPAAKIWDKPRFGWRGLLLDVSRHFRDKEFVKRYIDLLAYNKLNVLHWHLVDDQGWRLEIKKYPKLTEIGAWRIEGGQKYGGFYTQDDVREVVAYAASRYVTVVPEIEMPGHSNAALAAYPENSCTGGPFKVPSLWGVFDDVYCAGKDGTLGFLQDILTETMALFPSRFIHIGGDEVPKTKWQRCADCQHRMVEKGLKSEHELQSWFIHQMDTFLASKGRRLVGWDEILEGGLAPGATVQSWHGMDGAIQAARMGHDVVVSPTNYCYLDYSHDTTSVEKSYSFEPVPEGFTPEQARRVLGGEGNMWAEHTPLPQHTDRQVFPRLCALAEVYWSPKEVRDYRDFARRLGPHLGRLASMGVRYFVQKPSLVGSETVFTDWVKVSLARAAPGDKIVYTLDGREPWLGSPTYVGPFKLFRSATLRACTVRGRSMSDPFVQQFRRESLRPSVDGRNLIRGIRVQEYHGSWGQVPNFYTLTADLVGETDTIGLGVTKRTENLALVFDGYVEIPGEGIYTFYVNSDDGTRLYIDGDLIVDNDGPHGAIEKSGQAALRTGKHAIRLEYYQGSGGRALEVSMAGPGYTKRQIPATALWMEVERVGSVKR
jgi:hexosaminidase